MTDWTLVQELSATLLMTAALTYLASLALLRGAVPPSLVSMCSECVTRPGTWNGRRYQCAWCEEDTDG